MAKNEVKSKQMYINIKAKNIDLTPSVRVYAEKKFAAIAKLLKRFDSEGMPELLLLISRTTAHHHKGEVYLVKADLRLPKKVLRAEERSADVRAAIDALKNVLHIEVEKYKSKNEEKKFK